VTVHARNPWFAQVPILRWEQIVPVTTRGDALYDLCLDRAATQELHTAADTNGQTIGAIARTVDEDQVCTTIRDPETQELHRVWVSTDGVLGDHPSTDPDAKPWRHIVWEAPITDGPVPCHRCEHDVDEHDVHGRCLHNADLSVVGAAPPDGPRCDCGWSR
jgi:hypothetical protein